MMTTPKATVVLNAPRDWEAWSNMIWYRATMAKVWKFMDPSTPKDQLPTPTKTPLPSPTDVNSEKMLIGDLTPIEREELRVL